MKNFIVALGLAFLLGSSTVHADRVDYMNQLPAGAYCEATAEIFFQGVKGKLKGFGRDIKPITSDILGKMQRQEPVPMESMYFIYYESLTLREREFFDSLVYDGWDAAEGLIKALGRKPHSEDLDKLNGVYIQGCVAKKLEKHTFKGHFIKTASGEGMAKDSHWREAMALWCDDMNHYSVLILESLHEGATVGTIIDYVKSLGHLSEVRKGTIVRMLTGLSQHRGPYEVWKQEYLARCN